jgi:hypothetical protein
VRTKRVDWVGVCREPQYERNVKPRHSQQLARDSATCKISGKHIALRRSPVKCFILHSTVVIRVGVGRGEHGLDRVRLMPTQTIDDIFFTTFATPHLGTRKPRGTLVNRAFSFVAPLVTVRQESQFFLRGDHNGRPLLVAMAEEDSDYCRALQLFPHKSLYANVTLNYLVLFFTSCMRCYLLTFHK